MKTSKILAIAAMVAAFASCKQETPVEEPSLVLSSKTVNVNSDGGNATIKVTANNDWSASVESGSDWILAEKSSDELVITVSENTSYVTRMGSVKVSSATLTETINVNQTAAQEPEKLEMASTPLNFEAAGGEQSLTISANVGWTATANAAWVTVDPASGNGDGTIKITVAQNMETSVRNAELTVKGVKETVKVAISQDAKAADQLDITPSSAEVEAAGGSATIAVTANIDWTASASESWVSVSPASGSGNGSVSVTVAANDGAARTASVTVSGGSLSKTFSISQAAKPADPVSSDPVILACWETLNSERTAAASPDFTTTGKAIAKDGTNYAQWVRAAENVEGGIAAPDYIISSDGLGQFAIKKIWTNDAFEFHAANATVDKGKTIAFYVGLQGTSAAPKLWSAKISVDGGKNFTDATVSMFAEAGAVAFITGTSKLNVMVSKLKLENAISGAEIVVRVYCPDGTQRVGSTTALTAPSTNGTVRFRDIPEAALSYSTPALATTFDGPTIQVE